MEVVQAWLNRGLGPRQESQQPDPFSSLLRLQASVDFLGKKSGVPMNPERWRQIEDSLSRRRMDRGST